MKKLPVILAVDTKDELIADQLISYVSNKVDHIKLGLEFYLKNGADCVARLQQKHQFELFLDLKLHDIPNTVANAVESVAKLNPKFLTVHAQGGAQMIKAAAEKLPKGNITAVTVLTSISDSEFTELGFEKSISAISLKLADIAAGAGAKAIVCSPLEVSEIAKQNPNLVRITPGVRLQSDQKGDQVRTMTPKAALQNGANFLVIGRPITSLFNQSNAGESKDLIDSKLNEIESQIN